MLEFDLFCLIHKTMSDDEGVESLQYQKFVVII